MTKYLHEIRDPIHGFIRLDSLERKALDSRPFQRLRHIHQLAMAYLVYPGATHRRFEHSLGVMDLAGRIYDIVTDPANILDDAARDLVPEHGKFDHQYWRRVVRMAALCHDVGHLPFSHAAEDMLPHGMKHEHLSIALIESEYLRTVWAELNVKPDDVAKLAVGPGKYTKATFTDWESILSEIIIGDAFGADRIDYLLRDSHHAGVAYGKFDHLRLIDTLRILPKSYTEGRELSLGIDLGGLHAAEALILARYFMYTQVYFHHIRRAYDMHLQAFLKASLRDGMFSTDLKEHLETTDNEIMADILFAARTPSHVGHIPARLIVDRDHFRLLYRRNPDDMAVNPLAGQLIHDAVARRYGNACVHYFTKYEKDSGIDFPVWSPDRRIASSVTHSEVLKKVPVVAVDYVFIAHDQQHDADHWLRDNRVSIITSKTESEG
jgi:HD superfamily phosphohydrolase